MELRELHLFIAIAEEGGISAAARRLHVSQPALSQTVSALERQLGVKLLVRNHSGAWPTDAGATLLAEARALLARHDQAIRVLNRFKTPEKDFLRIGIPLELPPGLLGPPLAWLAEEYPETQLQACHLSTAAQLDALRNGELDIGLLRERPGNSDLEAIQILKENLGVLLSTEQALALSDPNGIRLENLRGLDWVGFTRSTSPGCYDELTATLRQHGVSVGPECPAGKSLIAEVKIAAVTGGKSFALAPPQWPHPIPDSVAWRPLIGHPLVRRTWLAWTADTQREEVPGFIARFSDSH
ncbi:LysR substrate-binding domain-containing protein [Streptomyces sp. NPDC003393]